MDLDALKRQLTLHEGRRAKAYYDTMDRVTVGVGRNLTDKGLSPREIDYLLDNDIDECVADLASFPWFASLDPIRQRVLVDVRFNLGPTKLRTFKRLLKAMADRNYAKAATALRESLWYRQTKSRGVRLVEMMRSGKDYR